MFKRIIMTLTILTALFAVCAFADTPFFGGVQQEAYAATIVDSGTCGDDLTWKLDDEGTLTISGMGDMDDYDYYAPWDHDVKSVVIGSSVTSIGDYAFYDCTFLESVTIGNGVTSIGDYAFSFCESLESITIPNSVTSIGAEAFYECTSLESVTMGNSVTSIGVYAFAYCDSLTSITIPNSVTSIGAEAFYYCELTSVTIGSGVASIGDYAFTGCSSLESINVSENNKNYCSIDGVLFNKNASALLLCPEGKSGKYAVPNSVTSIGDQAFEDCDSLASITIPNSVTSIGNYAFYGCDFLESVTIPNSVTSIGENAFENCTSLASVTIGSGVASIGDYAFTGCSSLESINVSQNNKNYCSIDGVLFNKNASALLLYPNGKSGKCAVPNSVTSIGDYAFSFCESLESINIPDSVTSIGADTFYGCTSLASITIPNSITSISDRMFYDCTSLASITIPDSVTSIGHYAFYYCTSLESINIPDSVTSIGNSAISSCTSLASITIPDSVTSIGHYAFCDCTSLESVTMGNSVTSIGYAAFEYCESITSITIPNSVTSIGDSAFRYCESLTSITIPNSVTSIGSYTFRNCDSLTDVYYSGTQNDWKKIDIGDYNECLTDAQLHFITPVAITKQPTNATAAEGAAAKVTLTAKGDGLTYTWYYKNKSDSSFSKTTSFKSNYYSVEMNSARSGRQVYCIVTDKYGNSVQSDTVTLSMPVKITAQPTNATAAEGKSVSTTVTAVGDGLTYKWYVLDPGKTSWYKSGTTTNKYSYAMTAEKSGRQVYCIVTDKYGNSVQSDTVTLTMASGVKITAQPKSVTAAEGATAKVTLTASGEGLTYTWYYKNKSASTFSKTTSFTSNYYSVAMDSSRDGRQVYCIVTNKYGNSVKSNTVTLTMVSGVKITAQPKSVTVAEGATAKVTLTASGEGLTYTWYYKNKSASAFSKTTSFTGNYYSVAMDSSRDGRQVYCIVTDKYGNSVKSNTVTLTMVSGVKITAQPKSVTAAEGATAKVTLTASGEGLTYTWYYKNKSASAFSKTTSFTSNYYSVAMDSSRDGRQVYCVVKDKYGNSVKSDTVTLTMAAENALKITKQPTNASAASGKTVSTSVTASGEGLTYTWYVLDPGKSEYVKSSITKSTYGFTMTAAKDGRKVYCVVKDANGSSVKSNTVTLSMD